VGFDLPVDIGDGGDCLLEKAYRADELERLDEPGRARNSIRRMSLSCTAAHRGQHRGR